MNNKIYVVTHKQAEFPCDPLYCPIQVGFGNELFWNDAPIIRDNSGDNISAKNSTFCELTAVYWLWKNIVSDGFIGIEHYRRYLSTNRFSNSYKYFLKEDDVLSALSCCDFVLPEQYIWKNRTVFSNYALSVGHETDLGVLRDTISNISKEYVETYDAVLNSGSAYYCNMLICSKQLFDSYCEWLFKILFEFEDIVDLSDYSKSQKRIFGYVSEILLNVWLIKNQNTVKMFPMINTEEPSALKVLRHIKQGKYNMPYTPDWLKTK